VGDDVVQFPGDPQPFLAGEPARPLGTSGQPATLNLTPANYKDYLIER